MSFSLHRRSSDRMHPTTDTKMAAKRRRLTRPSISRRRRMTLEALEGRRLLAVTGTVSIDANGNGDTDPGEQGLAGAIVYLDADRDGRFDADEVFARTQADGTYRIESPPVGRFELRQDRLDGYLPTGFGTTITVQAGGRDQTNVNLTAAPLVSIEGTVYHDENRDGGKSGPSPGNLDSPWTGAVVTLNQPTGATITNAFGEIVAPSITVSGKYEFKNLLPVGVTMRTPDGEVTGPESYTVAVKTETALQTFPVNEHFGEASGIAVDQFANPAIDAGPVALADFNGDGRLDIAVGTSSTTNRIDRIEIHYNFPASEELGEELGIEFDESLGARFEAGPTVIVPGIAPNVTALLAGDFDGDGLVDLAVASSGRAMVPSLGGSTLRAEDDYVAILRGGVNSDGEFDRLDDPIILANANGNTLTPDTRTQLRTAFGDDLFISAGLPSRTVSPVEITTATLGRQTLPYLVSINQGSDNVSLMHPIFAGAELHLPAGGTDVRSLAVADWNMDGFDDIVIGSFGGNVRMYLSNVIQVDDPATAEDELEITYETSDRNVGGNVVDMIVINRQAGTAPTLAIATVAQQFGTNEENVLLYSFTDDGFEKIGGLRTSLIPSSLDVWNSNGGVVQTLVVADQTTDRVQVFSVTENGYVEGPAISTRPALTNETDETDDGETDTNPNTPADLASEEGAQRELPPPFRDHRVKLMDLDGDSLPELISIRGAAQATRDPSGEDRDLSDKNLDGLDDQINDGPNEDRQHPGGVFVLSGRQGDFTVTPSFGEQLIVGDFGITFPEPIRLVSGRVFVDADGDGVDNNGEFGLSGVLVSAVNDRTGRRYEQVVADDGVYQFPIAELSTTTPDSLTITTSRPNGFRNTTAPVQVIQLQPGENGPDFGFSEAEASGRDYGDAPNSYRTLIASGGPSHTVTGALYLGDSIDVEPFPLVNSTATGDDRAGANDEDGVRISMPLIAGRAGEFEVSVTNVTNRNGYLRGWLDINGDGDFTDPGERIVSDRVIAGNAVGNGTEIVRVTLPFELSFDANGILDTFARFRLSSVPEVGIGGHVDAGEVEDYAVQIYANEAASNLAVGDRFVVARNALNSPLAVLENDANSIAHPLTIDPTRLTASLGTLTTTATPAGTQVLLYTPPGGYIGPVTLTYGVLDRSGRMDEATVFVDVSDRIGTVTVIDDTIHIVDAQRCVPSRFNCEIDVLANDSYDGSRPLRFRSVSDGSAGGTLSVTVDQTLMYRPVVGFVGVEQFSYTAENAADETGSPMQNAYATGNVTMVVGNPASMNHLAAINLQAIELNSDAAVSNLEIGDVFRVRVTADDLRVLSPGDIQGIASAFLDLIYPSDLVSPVDLDRTDNVPVSIQFGDRFNTPANQLDSMSLSDGVFNEFGGVVPGLDGSPTQADLEMLSHQEPIELFTVTMRAIRSGQVTIQMDPAETGVISLLDGSAESNQLPLSISQVRLGSLKLNVIPPARGFGGVSLPSDTLRPVEAEDVNLDAQVTALDALIIINELNRLNGSSGEPGAARGQRDPGALNFDASLDVNADGQLSAIDALRVINFLNTQSNALDVITGEPTSTYSIAPVTDPWQLADDEEDDMLNADWLEILAEDQSFQTGSKAKG